MEKAYEVVRIVGELSAVVERFEDLGKAKLRTEKLAHDEGGCYFVRDRATQRMVYIYGTRAKESG